MEYNDFDRLMDSFGIDPVTLVISETVEQLKKLIDGAAELHAYSLTVGLPEKVADEMALFFIETSTGTREDEDD
ncbi:hypothetical protein ACFC1L_39740 [Streptomyces sp. NPDC056210]|uniref:hypothetical protein n=1 Tax=Streptomyces sp. NPDC056210 TaxID=3345746 RepID=UPI0035E1B355